MFIRLVVLTLLLGSLSFHAHAQRGPAMTPEAREARLTEVITELELDEDQAEAFRSIHDKYAEKLEALRQDRGDRQAMRSQMMTLRNERIAEIKEVLTEEQFEALQELQREQRGRRAKGRRHSG